MNQTNFETSTSSQNHNDSTLALDDSHESSSSEQRNNFRGTKIARRARSFKDDFFEKISQIRTPTNTISRSHSPKAKNTQILTKDDSSKTSFDLNHHAKQVKADISHFKDVVNKNKLEMLHGNLTILLTDIANVHSALKAQKMNDTHFSSAIISATQQVHLNLGSLIKVCDEAMISDNEENYISLHKETVKESIENLENSVVNLVNLANEKADISSNVSKYLETESDSQRSSLPDIPLTNREKEELENSMQISQSSESILLAIKPPPKPSKDRKPNAPPLPPKKKNLSIDEDDFNMWSKSLQSSDRIGQLHNDEMDFSVFSSPINSLQRSKNISVTESAKVMVSSQQSQTFSEMSSHRFRDFKIETDSQKRFQEASSSSDITEIDNSLSFMSMTNQSRVMIERNIMSNENMDCIEENENPPPLPVKRGRSLRLDHHKSVYDNVEDTNRISLEAGQRLTSTTNSSNSSLSTLSTRTTGGISSSEFHQAVVKNKYKSCIESGSTFAINDEHPPPLPLKKKHIMAYMQIFGNATDASRHHDTLVRHSMHTFQSSRFESTSSDFEIPKKPALPPKKQKANLSNSSLNVTPPLSPKMSNESFEPLRNEESLESVNKLGLIPEDQQKKIDETNEVSLSTVVLRKKPTEEIKILNLMEELDVSDYLVFKQDNDGTSILVGGSCDALIIYATKNFAQKMSEAFGEAFLLTYRTFIEPYELIEKLINRYSFLSVIKNNDLKQKAAKEAFSLLVRVVNDLTSPDLVVTEIMEKLVQFVYDLVCGGELLMAKLLRVKIIEKIDLLKENNNLGPFFLPSRPIYSNLPSLLDLKSTDIAEQMTILDAELFQKIEIPEILIWAEQQNEEKSKNLTKFTEHFNKLSFWTRTQILKQQDSRDREKHVMKFIKIMKHLRKINNFNSYLALLSALDSAPIRRLEWQKNITEGLKEYCALIDSSSSFRAYRQALSETSPPCIPYIGLVLQDLTFVHIGNPDFLEDGMVNFSKRWQQSSLILNMKRFRSSSYTFKKNEKIIGFFDNFDEYFDEDSMWSISEKIKPRGKKNMH